MRIKAYSYWLCCLFCWCLVGSVWAVDFERPDPNEPTEVRVLWVILDVDNVDDADQTFSANVYYRLSWMDPRLASNVKKVRIMKIDDVWTPRAALVNLQQHWSTSPAYVFVLPNGRVYMRKRVWGVFSQPLDLRGFPLDKQLLEVRMGFIGYNESALSVVEDTTYNSGVADDISIADWKVEGFVVDVTPYVPYKGVPGTLSSAMKITLKRKTGFFFFKILVPLVLIVMMSWGVFWLPAKALATRIGLASTSMLTLIAYRFMIGPEMPHVSYMTRLDLLIFLSTVLVFFTLAITLVTTLGMLRYKSLIIAQKIDRTSRWFFPMAFFTAMLLARLIYT